MQLDLEKKDATLRQVYNCKDKTINLSKKSINDSRQNLKISLPGQLQVIKEAYINVRKDKYDRIQREYFGSHTNKGKQPSNLTAQEMKGLKSLLKRSKAEEISV